MKPRANSRRNSLSLSLVGVNLLVYERQNKRSGTRWVDYGSLGSLALRDASVCWIKEQSRPTHSLSLALSLATTSPQNRKEAATQRVLPPPHTALSLRKEAAALLYTLFFAPCSCFLEKSSAQRGERRYSCFCRCAASGKLRKENCVCVFIASALSRSALSAWWNQQERRICPGCRCQNCSRLPLGWLVSLVGLAAAVGWKGRISDCPWLSRLLCAQNKNSSKIFILADKSAIVLHQIKHWRWGPCQKWIRISTLEFGIIQGTNMSQPNIFSIVEYVGKTNI